MSSKKFYHDIDLVKVGQLVGARFKNVDNTTEGTLASGLGTGNVGLVIYNTEMNAMKIWNGTAFQSVSADITGDIVFRGVINPTNANTAAVDPVQGNQYVVDAEGTLSKADVTFSPSAVVEVGDIVLFTSATEATVLQRNIVDATTSQKGQVELATLAETNAGTDTTRAVTPASLADVLSDISANVSDIATNTSDIATNTSDIANLQSRDNVLAYSNNSVNVTANTPLTINHKLGLTDKDFFTIRVCDSSGSSVSVDVDSVDTDNITITSLVSLTALKVFILGI